MQHKELMTNSFPIALETQIADDLKTFGFLPDDTARAIDCVNADTFCKPANLVDTTAATSARILLAAWALTKWAAKTLQILALVAIGLSCVAFEYWQNRQKVKAAIKDQYLILCLTGAMALQLRVVIPVKELKARSRVAFTTLVNGLDY